MNTSPRSNNVQNVGIALFRILQIVPLLLLILIVADTYVQRENSLVVKAIETIGLGNAAALDAQAIAQAQYEADVQTALASVEALHAHYTSLAEAHKNAVDIALNMDNTILQTQSRMVQDSQWSKRFVSNTADIFCALSALDPNSDLNAACSYAQNTRSDMISEYTSIMQQHRTQLAFEAARSFPRPNEILGPEFDALQAKYRR